MSKAVGEADESGTWIFENVRTVWKYNYARFTHCDNRPPWEIVIRILSAK